MTSVDVLHPRPVRRDPRGPTGFASALTGRRIVGARRRGKYLWLPLDNGDALLGHLGMSGQLLVQPPQAEPERHLRVRLVLRDAAEGRELRFVDQRMFGGLLVSTGGAGLPPEISHIARDPLDPEFDDAVFVRRVRLRTSGVKRQLLDQGLVSGIGNIYADEALWRARLHGERPGVRLTAAQVRALLAHVREVLTEALGQGGTSFDALYVNVNGESGYFDRSLHAYGREGLPCDRCGTPVRRSAFMNRSSYFCPVCQPVPAAAPAAGLTGRRRGGTLEDGRDIGRLPPLLFPRSRIRTSEGSSMAKALIGYLNSDLRDPRLAAENTRLRARVGELQALVLSLSEENDRLVAARAAEILADTSSRVEELQPV